MNKLYTKQLRSREAAWNLNLNEISWDAMQKLRKVDNALVGTPNYMGVVYFWAHEYRHQMRPTSNSNRRRVHKKLLQAGLVVSDKSPEHQAIIDRWSLQK